MNIGIDIDDTITDTFSYMQPFLAEYFDLDLDYLQQRDISYNNLPAGYRERVLDFAKEYFDDVAADTPGKYHAAENIRLLREKGHRIIIITKRSNVYYTDCVASTQEELENLGIEYDRLICTTDKKEECIREKIDLMIDDAAANLDEVAVLGIPCIQFISRANMYETRKYPSVNDWDELLEMIEMMNKEA